MSTILDTSAWIELFLGTEKGKRVAHVLATDLCYSSISTLSEIVNWASKERLELSALINTVEKNSLVIELDKEAAILAGKLNFERKKTNKKWGMLDSFVLAVSLIHNLRILTKDLDFKDLPGAEIL